MPTMFNKYLKHWKHTCDVCKLMPTTMIYYRKLTSKSLLKSTPKASKRSQKQIQIAPWHQVAVWTLPWGAPENPFSICLWKRIDFGSVQGPLRERERERDGQMPTAFNKYLKHWKHTCNVCKLMPTTMTYYRKLTSKSLLKSTPKASTKGAKNISKTHLGTKSPFGPVPGELRKTPFQFVYEKGLILDLSKGPWNRKMAPKRTQKFNTGSFWWPWAVPEIALLYDEICIQKREAPRGENKVSVWYLSQNKGFGPFMKFKGKWRSTGHQKWSKIDALGALGTDFGDFWAVWWEAIFTDLSGSTKISKFQTTNRYTPPGGLPGTPPRPPPLRIPFWAFAQANAPTEALGLRPASVK